MNEDLHPDVAAEQCGDVIFVNVGPGQLNGADRLRSYSASSVEITDQSWSSKPSHISNAFASAMDNSMSRS